ncbi:MAG: hypothetical protein LBJ64_11455 [Deltaproteobacteria bacterium]|jgi:asparagine synthase (glutamine-hydrolysing)|nr:hypothetical protein [Deltaproteobacteria bacterium]
MFKFMDGRSALYLPGEPQTTSVQDEFIFAGQIFNPGQDADLAELMGRLARDPSLLNDYEADLSLIVPNQNRLVLIRDACGLTPLFYARHGDGWAAAFDLASLFKVMGRRPAMDEATFFDFVGTHYRHIFRDPGRTFHSGVRQVPAGHYVVLDENGLRNDPKELRWHNLPFLQEAADLSPQAASERYVELLAENVRLRLAALKGQNCAFTVSSGLDSSTVAALAARELREPVDCWFMAYKDQSGSPYDETAGVMALIEAVGWKLNRVDLTAPDLLAETEALMRLTLAPVATVTWLAHYVLARRAFEAGHRRLFSGLGGDESLAGEFEHFFAFFADLKATSQGELLDKETAAWARLHDHPVFKKSAQVRDDWLNRNVDFANMTLKVDRNRYLAHKEHFNPEWWEEMEKKAPPVPMPHPYPYFLSNRLYQEMTYETTPPTLWSEALSSQAAGVKGVFPMASPKLLALALSCPGTFKYENGLTKMLLRRGLTGLLPDCSRWNPVKTGFNAPLDLWLRQPKLADDASALLSAKPFADLHWLPKGGAQRIVDEHRSGRKNHMMLLWPLLSTALFLKVNSESASA